MIVGKADPSAGMLRNVRLVLRKVALVAVVAVVVAVFTVIGAEVLVPLVPSKKTTQNRAVATVRGLSLALEMYYEHFGSYPPDVVPDSRCSPEHQMSETLVYHLAEVEGRKHGPYIVFSATSLADADGDGFCELHDPWGSLFLYAQKDWSGKTLTVNDELYDVVSAGPDGKLGGTMRPGTGYVPATTTEGEEFEQDNITLDTEFIPGPRSFD